MKSALDGSLQPSYIVIPALRDTSATAPLVVVLHTWSFDFGQREADVETEAAAQGWLLMAPTLRGRSVHPETCGSLVAQQNVLGAVYWARNHYQIDERRIYILGLSSGGFMTILMAVRYPGLSAAASAWVGISELREWYAVHGDDDDGRTMRACFGGDPLRDETAASGARARSPIGYLTAGLAVPIDLAAGRFDSTVSTTHSLRATQAVVSQAVRNQEIALFTGPGPGLLRPAPADTASHPLFRRRIFLRREAGRARVTFFDGGHERLPRVAES